MGRKPGLATEIARRSDIPRCTVHRWLRGETRPRPSSLEKLRKAGVELSLILRAEYPRNVVDFARRRNLTVNDLQRLMGVRLKPIDLMTDKELEHILEAMSSFPKLYAWHFTSRAGTQS